MREGDGEPDTLGVFFTLLTLLGHGHSFISHSVLPYPSLGTRVIWDTMPQLPSVKLQTSCWGTVFCPYLRTHWDSLLEISQGNGLWRWPEWGTNSWVCWRAPQPHASTAPMSLLKHCKGKVRKTLRLLALSSPSTSCYINTCSYL